MNLGKETLEMIESLFAKAKVDTPSLDQASFVAGAKAIIEHLIDRL